MRPFAIAHLQMLALDAPDFILAAKRCGFDAVGLRLLPITPQDRLYPIITDKKLLKETQQRMADTGIKCTDVEIVRLTPDVEPEEYRGFLETGAALGAKTVTAHVPDANIERGIDKYGRLCEIARPLGLHVGIEFLPWSEVSNISAAARICKAVNADNCGILVDTLHFHRSASTVDELKALPPSWFRVLHLADCPAETPDTTDGLLFTARRARLLPGEGAVDFSSIIAALPDDISYTLEIPNEERVTKMGLESYCRSSLEVTKQYLARLNSEANSNVH